MEQASATAHALTHFTEPIQRALESYKNTKTTATYENRTEKIVAVTQQILAEHTAILENQASIPEQERALFYKFLNKAAKVYLSAETSIFTAENRARIASLLTKATPSFMQTDPKKMVSFFVNAEKKTVLSVHKTAWDLLVGKKFNKTISSFEKMQSASRIDPAVFSEPFFDIASLRAIFKADPSSVVPGSICFHSREELSFLGSLFIAKLMMEDAIAETLIQSAQKNPVFKYLASIWDKIDMHVTAGNPIPQFWISPIILNDHIPLSMELSKETFPKIRLSVKDFFSIMKECSPAKIALDILTKIQNTQLYATSIDDIYLFSRHIHNPEFKFSPQEIGSLATSLSASLTNLSKESLLPGKYEKELIELFQSLLSEQLKGPEEQQKIGKKSQDAVKKFLSIVTPFFENKCDFPPLFQSPKLLYQVINQAIREELCDGKTVFSKEERSMIREVLYAYCQKELDESKEIVRIRGSEGSIPVHFLMLALACPQYALPSGRFQRTNEQPELIESLFIEGIFRDGLYSVFQRIMLPKNHCSDCTPIQALQLLTFFDYMNASDFEEKEELESFILQKDSLASLSENTVVTHTHALSLMLTSLIAKDRQKLQKELAKTQQEQMQLRRELEASAAAEAHPPDHGLCIIA